MPKIDLHRHLEGSLRLSTLTEIAGRELPELLPELARHVQIQPSELFNAENFLSKFLTLRKFFLRKEVIQRFVYECIEDAAEDHLCYLELRFAPSALAQGDQDKLEQVIAWVVESAGQAAQQFGLPLNLLICLNRHEPVQSAERIVDCAIQHQTSGLVGFDLAGDEAHFSGQTFCNLLNNAKRKGFFLTIHAGEWGGATHITEAIKLLGADRIGHGVRIMEDERVVKLARQRQIPLEVCLTSNIQSGVFASADLHPLPAMLAAGLNITINSDDPAILNTSLSAELLLINEVFGFTQEQISKLMINSIDSAFLNNEQKRLLRETYSSQYLSWVTHNRANN